MLIKRRSLARAGMMTAVGAGMSALLVACGGGDSGSSDQAQRAFLEAMVPHHQSAVQMARVAERRAEHREIRSTAKAIVSAQMREIAQMRRIYRREFAETLRPNMDAHAQLGLSAEDAGMMMHGGEDMGASLRKAKPFDRAFIDAMIPHHQGAIRMARVILAGDGSTEIMQLADGIIRAQAQEIREMNGWRMDWYGSASPAGGVPKEGSMSGSMDDSMDDSMGGSGGEHDGH